MMDEEITVMADFLYATPCWSYAIITKRGLVFFRYPLHEYECIDLWMMISPLVFQILRRYIPDAGEIRMHDEECENRHRHGLAFIALLRDTHHLLAGLINVL